MANTLKDPPHVADRKSTRRAAAIRAGDAPSNQTPRNIRLIIGREYKTRVTQRGFIIVSVMLFALVAVAPFVPTIVQFLSERSNTTSPTQIVVVNTAGTVAGLNGPTLTAYITTALDGTATGNSAPYTISSQPPAAAGNLRQQVARGTLAILLVIARAPDQHLQLTYLTNTPAIDDSDLQNVQALATQLTILDTAARLGLTPAQTRSLFAPADLTVTRTPSATQNALPTDEIVAGYLLAFAGGYLLVGAVIIYGRAVADGVAEEKSSRVMEVLLNAATPWQLMAGKIVGIGAVGLTQMTGLVVVGIGAMLVQTPLQIALFGASAGGFAQYLTGVSVQFYLFFLLYFVLAFFLYATLFAGLGALLRRQDEVQGVVQISLPLVIGNIAVIYLSAFAPNSIWTRVLSYFPFWTPTLMLGRLARGTVAWWEIAATMAWMLVAICACAWLATRLYRYGVLMYGQRPGLGQLLRLARTN